MDFRVAAATCAGLHYVYEPLILSDCVNGKRGGSDSNDGK